MAQYYQVDLRGLSDDEKAAIYDRLEKGAFYFDEVAFGWRSDFFHFNLDNAMPLDEIRLRFLIPPQCQILPCVPPQL